MDAPSEVSRLPLTSSDPLAERLGQLRALFPEAESEGRLDLEKLRAVLGEGAAFGPERYGLSWQGIRIKSSGGRADRNDPMKQFSSYS